MNDIYGIKGIKVFILVIEGDKLTVLLPFIYSRRVPLIFADSILSIQDISAMLRDLKTGNLHKTEKRSILTM
ncbi:hypothetical protein DYD21_18215 [Rhodohalobacter sp. SW132]|nr:hypothetical protein DYD21_18215 [Rhodohalobacter sp. SW132]